MDIHRIFAMPNQWTFKISPVKKLLKRYVGDGRGWVDPFAGFNSPAEFTNDLNPKTPTNLHLEALEFVKQLPRSDYVGVLYDPPYSLRQIKECYNGIGGNVPFEITTKGWRSTKDILATKIRLHGHAISFGWNSMGFGPKRAFRLKEILLIAHG